jgi:hypothetical protein
MCVFLRVNLCKTYLYGEWISDTVSQEVKRPGREADHSRITSANVKNTWSYSYVSPPYNFMEWGLIKRRDNVRSPKFHIIWTPKVNSKVVPVGEWRYSSTHSLTSALDGGEWSVSLPGRFTPRERVPNTHWIGGWVCSRAILDAVVKGKILSPRRESNPRTPKHYKIRSFMYPCYEDPFLHDVASPRVADGG